MEDIQKWTGKVKHEDYAYKLLLWGFFLVQENTFGPWGYT
jgi:hypothetical protein